jgi:hypothetical protein
MPLTIPTTPDLSPDHAVMCSRRMRLESGFRKFNTNVVKVNSMPAAAVKDGLIFRGCNPQLASRAVNFDCQVLQ